MKVHEDGKDTIKPSPLKAWQQDRKLGGKALLVLMTKKEQSWRGRRRKLRRGEGSLILRRRRRQTRERGHGSDKLQICPCSSHQGPGKRSRQDRDPPASGVSARISHSASEQPPARGPRPSPVPCPAARNLPLPTCGPSPKGPRVSVSTSLPLWGAPATSPLSPLPAPAPHQPPSQLSWPACAAWKARWLLTDIFPNKQRVRAPRPRADAGRATRGSSGQHPGPGLQRVQGHSHWDRESTWQPEALPSLLLVPPGAHARGLGRALRR